MRDPLNKRFIRELRSGIGRYLVIFILIVISIGEVSGFLVADNSLIHAYEESFDKYNVEDGNFTSATKLTSQQKEKLEEEKIKVYEDFFTDQSTDTDTILRIYKDRKEVNTIDVLNGSKPVNENEIAIDRLYAQNNGLAVGDDISVGDDSWHITGLVALPDYSCLFQSNTDMIYDNTGFGVAIVSDKGWERVQDNNITYRYSWKYNTPPENETKEKEVADDLLKVMSENVLLSDYIPRYMNRAIQFTGEDFGKDRAMIQMVLYMIIVILAFIFGVMAKETINNESGAIGTLLSSGYKKGELLRHYLFLPVMITVIGAVVGNILGYTLLKDLNAKAYLESYSLTSYKTLWNAQALLQTTIIPAAIVLIINFIILRYSLSYSPLNFLRRDLSRKGGKRAMKLSHGTPIMSRFRKRIFAGNLGSYAVIIVGVLFSNVLLMFGFIMPSTLDNYNDRIYENMICKYTYVLKAPVETKSENAYKFTVHSLKTLGENGYISEDVSIYGVSDNDEFISIKDRDKIYTSKSYSDKYHVKEDDTIILKEKYEDKNYEFKVGGVIDYEGEIALFTGFDNANEIFGNEKGYFNGYHSDEEIRDIDDENIATIIDAKEMGKVSRQIDKSLRSIMYIICVFAVVLFVIIIYLLSRLIIEKSAKAISLSKILGYKDGEIGGLYVATTSIVVIAAILATTFISKYIVGLLYTEMLTKTMSGWLPFYVGPDVYVKMIVIGTVTYVIVALLELLKIKKMPMNMALKDAAL